MPPSRDPTSYPDMEAIVAATRHRGEVRIKPSMKPHSFRQRFYHYRAARFRISYGRGDREPSSGINDIKVFIDGDAVVFQHQKPAEALQGLTAYDAEGNPISLTGAPAPEPDNELSEAARNIRKELGLD